MFSGQLSDKLLKNFNRRDSDAFGEVYSMIYDELTYFAAKLYGNTTVSASDAVQDAFLYLWQHHDLTFGNIRNIKSYLYLIIKNRFLNHMSHRKHVDKYVGQLALNDDWILTQMVESEVYSSVKGLLKLLPEDCARIFEYHINGWNAKEIARKLEISERTVYNKQSQAIKILKDKFPKDGFLGVLLYAANHRAY